MSNQTIRIRFGESVAEDQKFFVAEWDDELNVDSTGEVKSQFESGDNAHLYMHYNSAELAITSIKSTTGEVFRNGSSSRTKTDNATLFESPSTPVELSHRASGVSAVWYGRSSVLDLSGRQLTAASCPCIGDITYSFPCELATLVLPGVTLAADQEFPFAVVIEVEAVAG